jgi:hypothetical protein
VGVQVSKPPGAGRVALDLLRAQREGASGLARRQEARLVAMVTYARARSPYYERLYRDLPDGQMVLRDLPPVAKPELMSAVSFGGSSLEPRPPAPDRPRARLVSATDGEVLPQGRRTAPRD